ncbi:MAG: T9SS C-terminal target domain-containing protein [bacterium TMED46]|nr:MAG: T9SS C-terminal target domain-containing protein [bacterium TMED46]
MGYYIIKLFSITGAEVTSKTIWGLNKGSHIISMDMKGLSLLGSYILRVNSEQQSLNRKVIYLK